MMIVKIPIEFPIDCGLVGCTFIKRAAMNERRS